MNGPPLAIYGGMRRWSPEELSRHAARIFSSREPRRHGWRSLAGLWTASVTRDNFLLRPAMLPAIFLGVINRRLHGDTFLRYAYIVLLGVGTVLLIQSAKG